MSTDLGRSYTMEFAGQPPHMSREDTIIWDRYKPQLQPPPSLLYFDVGLGVGKPGDPALGENLNRAWTRLTQKRADVIAEFPNSVAIIELRDTAQSNAVGRLMMYAQLWNEDPPIKKQLQLQLVTNYADQDVARLCAANGILYKIV